MSPRLAKALAAAGILAALVWILQPFLPAGEGPAASLKLAGGPFLLLGVCAAAAVYLAARFSRRERGIVPGRSGLGLLLLRDLAILLVLFALAEPLYRYTRTDTERPRVAVVLDRSASMAIADKDAPLPERLAWADAFGWAGDGAKGGRPVEEALERAVRALGAAAFRLADARAALDLPAGPAPSDAAKGVAGLRRDLREVASGIRRSLSEAPAEGPAADAVRKARPLVEASASRIEGISKGIEEAAGIARAEPLKAALGRLRASVRAEAASLREALSGIRLSRIEALAESGHPGAAAGADRAAKATRLDLARALLWGGEARVAPRLADRYELRVFPEELGAAEGAGRAPPLDAATDLAAWLGDAARSPGKGPLGAVVLVSDFRNNRGGDPAEAARRLGESGVPVFAVGVGTRRAPKDIAVTEASAPRSAQVGEKVDLEVRIRADGFADLPVGVVIKEGERVVHGEEAVLSGDGRTDKIPIAFDPGAPGIHAFTVSVPAQNGEASTENNERPFTVTVEDGKIHVLVVETRPRWEYRFLERILYRYPRFDANRVLLFRFGSPERARGTGEGMLPPTKADWMAYDAVILGDADPAYFRAEDVEGIRAFVAEKGGGLVVIAGERFMPHAWARTALPEILPVVLEDAAPDPAKVRERWKEGFAVRPTEKGRDSPLLQVARHEKDNDETWRLLPPLFWAAPVKRAKPAAELLAEAVPAGGAPAPLVAAHTYGLGRVLFVGTDETWRWRWRVGDVYHHRFWGQVLGWAIGGDAGAGDLARIRADRDRYSPGEPVVLEATLKGPDRKPLDGVEAWAVLASAGKPASRVALPKVADRPGLYRARVDGLASGAWRARLEAPAALRGGAPPEAAFAVEEAASEEMLSLSLDADLMGRVAEASGGAAFDLPSAPFLPDLLDVPPVRKPVTTDVELWDTPSYFAFLVLVLTVEWALRKRWGLP